jgi:signal transduction histidine kinase/ligand-binding sensor domain-containing protein/DNA-binding response OmpR family regulator
MRSLLTILLLIFSVVGLHAQEQFKFRQLTIDNGLSHNQVNAIYKDKLGFVWIGTHAGLNRFDGNRIRSFFSDSRDTTTLASSSISRIFPLPDGKLVLATAGGLNVYDREHEQFSRNAAPFLQKFNVPDVGLTDITEDAKGNFWFVYDHTVALYRVKDKRTFLITHDPTDTMSLTSAALTGLTSDNEGNVWIAHADGVFEKIHAGDNGLRVSYRDRHFVRGDSRFYSYRIYADSDGDLWFLVINDNQGVYHFDVPKKEWNHYTSQSEGIKLSTTIVSMLVEDNNGLIWVGTDHGGVNLIDKRKKSVRYITHIDEDETSLAQNSVNYLYKDDLGILWLGTYKRGISFHNENIFRFPVYQHHAFDPASLPFDDVNRFVEDDKGNIWIGTNGGGLIYFDRAKGTFKQYLNRPGDPQSLSSNVIVSLEIDHEKKLWVGTYYGGLNVFDGRKFTRFTNDAGDTSSISGKNIWEIFEDSRHNLWIGTIEGGVNRFDRRTGTFERLPIGQRNGIRSPYISEVMEDHAGSIWFGTGTGIDVYDPIKKSFQHFEYSASDKTSLSNNNVFDIHQDASGRIWVGTFEGLNLFNPENKSFTVYRDRNGLSHNTILTIQEDSRGHIWLGTPNGLSEMLPDANGGPSFRHYTPADGLQGLQFNENASYKTRSGELFFGGPMGFNVFTPEQLKVSKNRQRIVLTDFQLFQKSLRIGESVKGRVILSKAITETKKIMLPTGQNYFSIEYSTLNYFHSEQSEVQYMLEGLSQEWLPADNDSRKLTFTGLNSGDYILKFRIANEDGTWAEQENSLAISVLPPFWKTNFAFFLYMAALAGVLYLARKLIAKREKMKYMIEHERQEAIRMHELDMMKIKFFTNVSHEFRTPLTLILTPLEKMIQLTTDQERRKQYSMIQRNAKRLLNLVNQLLDFRKLEVQEVRFNPSEGDIISFIRETVFSFSDLSEKKDVRLDFTTTVKTMETLFDPDKLEKILFNLLSNAFKFTPEHGAVGVHVDTAKRDDGLWLMISVSDSGIGIPADKLDRVFDRFFQAELPKTIMNQGSGIGLSITREFVRVHGGEIKVKSERDKGTEFIVSIPVKEVLAHVDAVDALPEKNGSVVAANGVEEEPVSDDNGHLGEQNSATKTLLLVEDNDDFRFYLKDNLKQFYSIAEARNGDEGWRQTLAVHPDLVVSDVMMPGINGMELCRKIKNDERVSHIPVILLTARSAEEQKLEGIQMGADDYITKPFNFEILESRIRNLIELREKSQKVFRKTLDVKASELNITPLDQKFIENAIRCVEQNVSSPDFSVEHLGRELGISRAYLYKKIVALTGKSPLEFIRTIRLQHAAQLLEKSQLTVAEVAYQVGFNNPKYFTKYFKEEFNMLPSIYGASKKKPASK